MFKGVFTALITPFTASGELDEHALRALVDAQIAGGVQGLVPMGTTGESPTVTHEENLRVIEIVIKQSKGRVPVIAGTGSNSTQEAIDMTKKAKALGATASLQVAPYYNKPSQEGFFQHFNAIADAVDLPLLIYNIPGRTAKNVELETVIRLARHKNIVGIKEASGSLSQVMETIAMAPKDFTILSGDDNWTWPIMALGGHGVISVASNLLPKEMVALSEAALAQKQDEATVAHYKLLPIFRALSVDTNPIPIKYAMSKLGLIREVYRLPLCSLSAANKLEVDKTLKSYGLI